MTSESQPIDHEPWPVRAPFLLGFGALAGLAVHSLVAGRDSLTTDPVRLGAAALIAVGAVVFAFTLERLRWTWSAGFGLAAGLVVGFVTFWNGSTVHWGSTEGWRLAAALLAVAVAVPLFQAARDAGSRRIDPRIAHDHAWTDAILAFLAWAFVVAAWLLANLLGELFALIGVNFLRRLLSDGWFAAMLLGGALGAAIGLIRDRDRVLGLLQSVGRTILSFLAPVLAAGLVFFVVALAFTGLGPLWRETAATTPILLACMAGALVLANAVIGNAAEEEPKSRILAWAAMALGAVMLPLAIVAAVSMGKRIGQYGFTPDRLWAAVVVAVAVAGAAFYLVALVRGRMGWTALVRRANVALALGICLLALFLALPIVSFGAISTRDQLARLESGRVAPDRFDWAAMRFDFGPSGKAALERMARGRDSRFAGLARRALAMQSRWDVEELAKAAGPDRRPVRILVRPADVPIPPALRDIILDDSDPLDGVCAGSGECLLFWKPGDDVAIAVLDGCAASQIGPANQASPDNRCSIVPTVLTRSGAGWKVAWSTGHVPAAADSLVPVSPGPGTPRAEEEAMLRREREAIDRGEVEVREVKVRQLFIGGKPVSQPFK